MSAYQHKLKSLFSAKNIADAAFALAILVYLGCHLLLLWLGKQLGFFEVLAVLLYGGLSVVALSVVSAIARAILLYKYPFARTRTQKVLLVIAAIPLWQLLLKASGVW